MRIVSAMTPLDAALAREAVEGPATPERHADLAARAPALREVELRPAPPAAPATRLRLAAWNLERCKALEPSAELLARAGVDIALLSEMDLGMARSGHRNTARDLADALGGGYAFATEFVELGIGNQSETLAHAGEANTHALHGNAVVSRQPFRNPAVIPLEAGGSWWALDWHHRRLGGRMALAVTVDLVGLPVRLVSAHLESLPGPGRRANQVRHILDHVEATAGRGGPAVVAGDMNASELPPLEGAGAGRPDWFVQPEIHEPLFDAMAEAGFGWLAANTPEPTRRTLANGRPAPPFNRLDWFFVRGLEVMAPLVWPAVDAQGAPISDHELITVDVAPA
ncbi:MAG TPA: endonuclease/exonuclease/phosphatase family protein [Salinarimonas sp.]|nr:endonuclease/exonuclease/phosphatase family protein [Salinarimonas sp.]